MKNKPSLMIISLTLLFVVVAGFVLSKIDSIVWEVSQMSDMITERRVKMENSLDSYTPIVDSISHRIQNAKKISASGVAKAKSLSLSMDNFASVGRPKSRYERLFLEPALGTGWWLLKPSGKWILTSSPQNLLVWKGVCYDLPGLPKLPFNGLPLSVLGNDKTNPVHLAHASGEMASGELSPMGGNIVKVGGTPGEPGTMGSLPLGDGLRELILLSVLFILVKAVRFGRK